MYPTLREFLTALDKAGELRRVKTPVASILEISEITDRMSQAPAPRVGRTGMTADPDHAGAGGSALLFENVRDVPSRIPVGINLFGSYHRLEMALGCHDDGPTPGGFDAIAGRIANLTRPVPPAGIGDLLARARDFTPLLRIPPRRVRSGRCQQIVQTGADVDLFKLPIIKCWPLDGDLTSVGYSTPPDQPDTSEGRGRFITFAGMYTIHADDEGLDRPPSRNIGMYRAQLIDRNRLAMHWHIHHDGAAHWRSWKRRGKPMPIAIVFGGESVLPYAATAPLPPGISELLMAGFLNGGGIPLVRGRTIPLDVPANAEIVIEGYVSTEAGFNGFDPGDGTVPLGPGAVLEGPFGDHTGFYSLPDRYPILSVSAITSAHEPILPATIVGIPLQEDYYLGKATERIFLPLLKTLIQDIVDYDLPLFGAFHNCAFVKIHKEYPLQARRVMHAIWGAGQMAWTKIVVVVDEDVNVHRLDEVLRAIATNTNFARDLELVNGPLDILDHAAPRLAAGGKLGIDATRKIRGEDIGGVPHDDHLGGRTLSEEDRRLLLEQAASGDHVLDAHLPPAMQGRLALITMKKTRPNESWSLLDRLIDAPPASELPDAIMIFDAEVDIQNVEMAFFHACANCDVRRDILRRGRSIGVDATTKSPAESRRGDPVRRFPPPLRMSDEIRARVTRRWSEYGLGEPLPPVGRA